MFKKNLKKILSNMDTMLLIFILIASVFSIKKEILYRNINICINILMIFYILIISFKKKNFKIIQSKMDIFFVLFTFSTLIPLITNSFVSLSSTIETILNYITLFWVYILSRQFVKKSENRIQYIKNISIIITIVLIVLGIENLSTDKVFDFLKIDSFSNGEKRLVSLITNPNAFAAIIMFNYFISINEMLICNSNKNKVLYGCASAILVLGILLTYSKFAFIIFICFTILYFCLLKNKSKRIYMLHSVILSIVMSLIYMLFFQNLLSKQYYLSIFIFSLLWLEIIFLWNKLIIKVNSFFEKIAVKKFIISFFAILLVAILWINFELNNKKEFVVFAENAQVDYNAKILKKIRPNTKYAFSFDIDAKIWGEKTVKMDNYYKIRIIERDSRSLEEIAVNEIEFSNFSGKKEIELVTNENTSEIKLEFKAKSDIKTKYFILKELLVNNEEVILEYKHLPTKLVEKIEDISFQYKTAQERMHFIKDGLKLIKNNFLTGIGGNCWRYKYGEIQEYGYNSNDVHCYYIQVWLEFGILGLVGLLGIVFFIIYPGKINKDKMDKFRGIQFGLIAVLIHCSLDVDMRFWFVQLMFFIGLGAYSALTNDRNANSKNYITKGLIIIIALVNTMLFWKPEIYNGTEAIGKLQMENKKFDENSEQYKDNYFKMHEIYEKMINYERYNLSLADIATQSVNAYILSERENAEEELEKYYNRIISEENKWKHESKYIVEKSNDINLIIQVLYNRNEQNLYPVMVKLAKINIDEFQEAKQKMNNALEEKHLYPAEQIEYRQLLDNYGFATKVYERYSLGIKVNNTTDVDLTKFEQDANYNIENKKDIVIYHTHTTEAYKSEDYEETEYKKTKNEKYNILSVGDELTDNLKQNGFEVTHLRTYNDIDGIKSAYDNSYDDVKSFLKKQENKIDIVFDVHRDSYLGNENEENNVQIDSKNVAKLRFIIAVGHENWESNLSWAIKIQKKADELYPGLFKPMYIYDKNYNQDVSKGATLLEVGHDENTIEEAKGSMYYFANVVKEVLNLTKM